jgi:hypothetical protein
MGVRRLDIRFRNIAGQGATLIFVGGVSHNIGGLTVACNGVGQRKRHNCLRAESHSISHIGIGRGQVAQGEQAVPGGSHQKTMPGGCQSSFICIGLFL